MKVTWIGTGIMGAPMALNLSKEYDVTVYNRTHKKAEVLKPNVKVAENIEDAVKNSDVIFTIVGYPEDVKNIYQEIFKYAKRGSICIDMTTSSPRLAKELFEMGVSLGIEMLDAPVTGGDLGAINGTLSIMVGGKEAVFKKVYNLLELLGTTITYVGDAGKGQLAKLTNQIAIAGTLLGVAESLTFAKENNLDLNLVYKILNGGSAASTQFKINGLKMINEDFRPGFYVKHFLKDLKLAKSETKSDLKVLDEAIRILEDLVINNHGDLGTQSVIKKYINI